MLLGATGRDVGLYPVCGDCRSLGLVTPLLVFDCALTERLFGLFFAP